MCTFIFYLSLIVMCLVINPHVKCAVPIAVSFSRLATRDTSIAIDGHSVAMGLTVVGLFPGTNVNIHI